MLLYITHEQSLQTKRFQKKKPDWTAGKSKSFSSEAPPDSPTLSKKVRKNDELCKLFWPFFW